MSPESIQTWLNSKPDRREPWHDERYARSLLLVETLRFKPQTVADIGERSIFTDLASWCLDKMVHSTEEQDCRYQFRLNGSTNELIDLIFCLEVLEHIHDLPAQTMDTRDRWTGSGQLGLLCNIRKHMHDGSLLILTTPNACGPRPLKKWLEGARPMFFDAHVRELLQQEVLMLADFAGLEVVIQGGWTLWDSVPVELDRASNPLRHFDDLWFVFRKKQ